MIIGFLTGLTITVLGYAILAFSYLGLGWASSLISGIGFSPKEKPFNLIWLGWAITLALLQVLNLFVRIAVSLSIFFLVLGIVLAVAFLKIEFRDKRPLPIPRIYLVMLAVVAIWVATQSMLSPKNSDSGLYHFNAIRWLNESPIVLGLGNLHSRLAFNQSFFAYVAYLNLYPLFNHGYNLANSFLMLILWAECLYYLSDCLNKKDLITGFLSSNVISISFIPVLIYLALNSRISSPTPDIASSILQILIFIRFVHDIDDNLSTKNHNSQIIFILIMSATAITVKLSNLFYVLSICIILVSVKLKFWQPPFRQTLLGIVKLIALPTLILIIWGFRGVLLSGCPAYPSAIGCINANWAVPIQDVKSLANLIYNWARQPGQTPDQVLNSWAWVAPWFYRAIWGSKVNVVYPLVISILIVIMSFLIHVRVPLSQKVNKKTFLIPVPILIGLVFWFYLAPDVRFAHALFWILPVSVMIVLIKIIESWGKVRNGFIVAMILIINANIIAWFIVQNPQMFIRISATGYMPIPIANLTEKRTLSGLEVLSPVQGDQCWDSKIPCTPNFNAKLNFTDNDIFPEFRIGEARK
jgi:hypothetical protein